MNPIFGAQGLTPADKLVFLYVSERIVEKTPIATQEEIALATGLHPITVRRCTRKLLRDGHIMRSRKLGCWASEYYLPQAQLVHEFPKAQRD